VYTFAATAERVRWTVSAASGSYVIKETGVSAKRANERTNERTRLSPRDALN